LGRGPTPPVWLRNKAQRTAEAALTLNRSAACRREAPAKISATTRDRRSSECAAVPMSSLRIRDHMDSRQAPRYPSITFDSTQLPDALDQSCRALGLAQRTPHMGR